jgi:hypothetical protein
MARGAQAQDNSCGAARGIKIQDARLVAVPDAHAGLLRLTLSGRAVISDMAQLRAEPAKALCAATIGDRFEVNNNHICGLFDGTHGGFSGRDKIRQDNGAVTFELSNSMPYSGEGIRIEQRPGTGNCAEQLVVEAHPGSSSHFASISSIPQLLAADRAEFLLHPGAGAERLDAYLGIDPDSGAASQAERPMFGPKSWNDPVEGIRVQLIVPVVLLSLAIALLFTYFENSHPFPEAFDTVSDKLKTPLTVVMAFYAAAALMDCASDAAAVVLRGRSSLRTSFEWIVQGLNEWAGSSPRVLVEMVVLAGCLLVFSLIYGIVRLLGRRSRRFGPVIEFPLRALSYGSLIAFAAYSFGGAVWLWGEPLKSAGFETPALLISMLYALIAVHALKNLFGLSSWWVVGIALIVAITAFYPSDPVFSSSMSNVRIGDNTAVWARFLCRPAANFLYVATLAGLAFRISECADLDNCLVARWLIFLIILQIASFSLSDPTNALAVMGVVLIACLWLLAPPTIPVNQHAGHAEKVRPSIDWQSYERTFPLVVGGGAAFVFLMQFIFEAGGTAAHHKFALLGLANVPRTFAIGYCAGLVLSRGGPALRGDSATLKAANISLLILLTNIASALVFLQGRQRLVGALASSLGVIASLILSAMIVYDLQRARAHDGDLKWRDLFKGTTLARGVPIISALAVALFSALSPIFIREIGDEFGALLKSALPQVATGG